MTATTIKVDSELRDRLKAQASAQGLTLGQHLAALADLDERRHRFARLRDQVRNAPLAEWVRYLDESAEWDVISGGGPQ